MRLRIPRKISTLFPSERGQGVVEFAILVPTLLLFFLGTVDFARFLYYQTSIQAAARAAAETASNPCPTWSTCYQNQSATPTNLILWSAYCEASPAVSLQPQFTSCTPSSTSNWSPTCSTGFTCTSTCSGNICINQSTSGSSCSSTQPCVTVNVGYNFHPISPWMYPFFNNQSCGSSSQSFTLCASATGRVYY